MCVDDVFSIDNNPAMRKDLVKSLGERFKITDLGEAKWILGMKVEKTVNSIHLDQEKYIYIF
jgi:hypothetical protein